MRRWTVTVAILALIATAVPATARFGFPDGVTERGAQIESLYTQLFIAGAIVFLLVFAALAFILIRFREKGGKGRVTFEKERDNIKAEAAWTIIPLIVVMWVGVISYQVLVDLDGIGEQSVEPELVVDITGFQWAWQAQYPDGVRVTAVASPDINAVKPFYVPADVPIAFSVTGADVIHSFNVVGLGQTLDAVPGVVNSLVIRDGLPEGEYFSQCKENCLNPGHAYMRAMVKAVPMDEYQQWIQDELAGAAAGLRQLVPVQLQDGELTSLRAAVLAQGAQATIQIANNDTAGHTFTFGNESVQVGPGALGTIEFNVTEAGTFELTDDGGRSVSFEAVEPEEQTVGLADFRIEPQATELEAGVPYVFTVENGGGTVHNLYIGMNGADGKTQALWHTRDISPGESETLLVIPGEAATLDWWCAVPGHHQLGMRGTVTVV